MLHPPLLARAVVDGVAYKAVAINPLPYTSFAASLAYSHLPPTYPPTAVPGALPAAAGTARRSKRSCYIYVACDFCRSRKKKCDRAQQQQLQQDSAQPVSCSQCRSAHVECVQSSTQRAKRQKRKPKDPQQQQSTPGGDTDAAATRRAEQKAPVMKVESAVVAAHVRPVPAVASLSSSGPSAAAEPVMVLHRAVSSSTSSESATVSPSRSVRRSFSPSRATTSPSSSRDTPPASSASESGDAAYPMTLSLLPISPLPPSTPSSQPYPVLSPQPAFDLPGDTWPMMSNGPTSPPHLNMYGAASPAPSTDDSYAGMFIMPEATGDGMTDTPQPSPVPLMYSGAVSPVQDTAYPAQHGRSAMATAIPALLPSSLARCERRLSDEFRLVSSSTIYCSSYFMYINAGLYFHLDETEFNKEYEAVHVQRSQRLDNTWLLCVSAVMAIGARMNADREYSEYCAAEARKAAQFLKREAQRPAQVGAERLALSYRSLMVWCYYLAAMKESCDDELDVAKQLLAIDGVQSFIPHRVLRLSNVQPTFTDAFERVGGNAGTSSSSSSSPSSHTPYGMLHPSVLAHQSATYPLDKWRYLKIKRILSSQLSLSPDDPELHEGEEWDASLDVTATLSAKKEPLAINAVFAAVTEAMQRRHQCQPLSFSLYHALALLLKAEASVLTMPERGGLFGMIAACYQLLGKTAPALRAARDCVGFITQLRSSLPTSLPPFCFLFVRCIALLGECDQAEGSAELIAPAMRILKGAGQLWPCVAAVCSELQAALEVWTERDVQAMQAELEDGRSRLEQHVLHCVDSNDVAGLLPGAAATFVRQTSRLQCAHHKRLSILGLRDVEKADDDTGPDARGKDSPRSGRGRSRSGSGEMEPLDTQWVVDNLSRLFTRSLEVNRQRKLSSETGGL